ncbi:MAG: 16S rRNA (adenine(1518)-N(6)/adenine(1519)-N(6))-dimethyltransferase [Rhodocyclales bacterium RIFCSPLOWO2_02_FULL_63_24]|nr:MAG: 16S rRNA (adenine(1518)-N(6)/adenine(1519)-N(6))-dimethyltransferase [Rhodocyclales bacterium GWA2_65_19]OHC69231.1 MAG: 16S rRNA (adenine(1518)-N(6)/adenine(1519)-N(6))-dimethyltransferase [Rhodocyclales bacterium RIFCSPLOWO2_02_FULL_63_24]
MKALGGHTARKRFGQNFLVSPGIIRKIVDAIGPQAGDTVVEIGPGLGALTEPLLERLDHLHVVEIDRDLIARLRNRFPPERLTVHEGDALEFDFGALKGQGPLKIVGNLPYNISSPLLFHLVAFAPLVYDMHFMLQKEVVDRMVAEPGNKDFGRLSVMLQYHYHMERMFIVPPGAFNPPPKIDSAIVRMIPVDFSKVMRSGTPGDGAGAPWVPGNPLYVPQGQYPLGRGPVTAKDPALFAKVVTAAFSQRRKMLRNTLREFISEADLAALCIRPTARAEDIAVADYVRLANSLADLARR